MTKKTTNINKQNINDVNSDIVVLKNSSANNISCNENISLNQSSAKNIYANDTYTERGFILKNNGKKAKYNESVLFINDSQEAVLNKTAVAINISENLKSPINYSLINYANNIKAKKINSAILFAKNVNGNVVTLFDNKSATILGVTTGVIIFMLSLIFKRK